MSEPTIAERLNTINTKLNTILTNTNTQLGNKGESPIDDLSEVASAIGGIEKGKLTNAQYEEANDDLDDIYEGVMLPNIYQQVEYLESSGTQYIDIGIIGTNNHGAEIVFAYTEISNNTSARLFGSRNGTGGTGGFAFISSNDGDTNSTFYFSSNGFSATRQPTIDTNWHKVSLNMLNDKKVYLDDVLIGTGNDTSFTAKASSRLFTTYNMSDYGVPTKAKVKLLKIYENGELIRNYIPCYRITDNEPGMYETITETFLTNDGTGTFAVGNDVDVLNAKIKNILENKTENAVAGNIKSGATILGVSGSVVELNGETKTITPSTSQQTIIPSSGKNAITQATVSAVDNTIDNNITAGNIKNGVTILGITGSYTGLDTSDANATASDIVTSKTAYVNGQKLTGFLVINKYYTGSGSPSSSLGNDGDLYLET